MLEARCFCYLLSWLWPCSGKGAQTAEHTDYRVSLFAILVGAMLAKWSVPLRAARASGLGFVIVTLG